MSRRSSRSFDPNNLGTGVCERNTPPEKNTHGNLSFKNTKQGAGEQFLPQNCMAKAFGKGVCFSQTPVCRILV